MRIEYKAEGPNTIASKSIYALAHNAYFRYFNWQRVLNKYKTELMSDYFRVQINYLISTVHLENLYTCIPLPN